MASKRTDGWNRISSRENIFRDTNGEMTGSSMRNITRGILLTRNEIRNDGVVRV